MTSPLPDPASRPPRGEIPAGAVTGVGSLPGESPLAAARLVAEELADFPHLPELPGRGPGADLIGRSAALLVDLHVDLQPSGWRFVERAGMDERRALGYLSEDLDAVEEVFEAFSGPLKVAVAGPWTLAAGIELSRGGRALGDRGAVRDLAQSLAAAAAELLGGLRRRVPGAVPVLQLDEPSLPAVLAAQVATESGFGRLRAVSAPAAREVLAVVVDAAHREGCPVVVHCCAAEPPLRLLRETGADAASVDLALLDATALDALGEWWDASGPGGVTSLLGVLPTRGLGEPGRGRQAAQAVDRLARVLGEAPSAVMARSVLTPACGLAGSTTGEVSAAYRGLREARQRLLEDETRRAEADR